MTIKFSKVLNLRKNGFGGDFSAQSVDLSGSNANASPVLVLDDFKVTGRPFGPHPHAGFSAVTYVLEDSKGSLRSLDSLGGNILMEPGGIVWTQAGRGALHEEIPADKKKELHGLQIFVNLSSKNKQVAPKVFQVHSKDIPEWTNTSGERVRVVVGTFEGLTSPLFPVEPFTLLDAQLKKEITFDLSKNHNALIYLRSGSLTVEADEHKQLLVTGQSIALESIDGGKVTFKGKAPSQFFLLSGENIKEPVVFGGSFIMNTQEQIFEAMQKYRKGEMGYLEPYPDNQ